MMLPRGAMLLVATVAAVGATSTAAAQSARPDGVAAGTQSLRPDSAPAHEFILPRASHRTLSNGLDVYVISRRDLPIVSVRTVVDAGPLLDPPGKEGLSALVNAMLGEATATMTERQLADAFADLGNAVTPQGFTTTTPQVERCLALLAEMLGKPRVSGEAVARQKLNAIAALQQSRASPQATAMRILNTVLYGAHHPYASTATERSLAAISVDDVSQFEADHIRPQNLKLLIVGDVTADALTAVLERTVGTIARGGQKTVYDVPAAADPGPTRIYLYDLPGAQQSVVRVGQPGPTRDSGDDFGLEILNTLFGGVSGSRLNVNLRQTHAFTYGAYSRFQWRRAPQPSTFISQADVSTPKTDSALVEWLRELRALGAARPVSTDELRFATSNRVAGLPARFETAPDVTMMLGDLLANDVPLDYFERFVKTAPALTPAAIDALARRYLMPDRWAIVVVGDRQQIESRLRAANIAPISIVDQNGAIVP